MAIEFILNENGKVEYNYYEINIPEFEEGAYEKYLFDYLSAHHFPQEKDSTFITDRCAIAYELFEYGRQQRMSVSEAQELALYTLTQGLENSLYDIISEILEVQFSILIPIDEREGVILDMFSKGLFREFEHIDNFTSDYLESEEGTALHSTLIDTINQYVNRYGIQ